MTAAVLDLVRCWAVAEQRNDPDALDGVLAKDFIGVGPVGYVLSRDLWLGRFRRGLENRAFTVEDPQVHEYGTAAVVVAVLAQETSVKGSDNSGRFRLTVVAVRPADRWLLASVHIGPLSYPTAQHAS
jgi:ketosteroid isomerase-like protein